MRKTLDRSTYLQACGLYGLAFAHARKCDVYAKELARLLGREHEHVNDLGHIGDEIWSPGAKSFDEVLSQEGFDFPALVEAGNQSDDTGPQ